MKRIKLLISFLILLLVIQPGCTVTAYHFGRDFSEKHPKKVKYDKTDDMKRGDVIELTMNDGSYHSGKLAYCKEDQFIGLAELDAEIDLNAYNEMQVYEWKNIKEIRRIDSDYWTGLFRAGGFLTDLTLVLSLIAFTAMGDALNNLN